MAGAGLDTCLGAALAKAGLTTDEVELTNLRLQEILPAIVSGNIDVGLSDRHLPRATVRN